MCWPTRRYRRAARCPATRRTTRARVRPGRATGGPTPAGPGSTRTGTPRRPGAEALTQSPVPRPAVPPDGMDRPAPPTIAEALGGWTPTRAFGRIVLLVGLLLFGAVLLRRVDLGGLAAPFAIGAALGVWRRPEALPQLSIEVTERVLTEGQPVAGRVAVGNPDPVGYHLVVVRAAASPSLRLPETDRPYGLAVA